MPKNKLNIDRTLILRICDERLQAHLREKMAAVEEEALKSAAANSNLNNQRSNFSQHQLGSSIGKSNQENKVLDLDGVTCEPAIQGSSSTTDATLWNFVCDGATYPARLTNLPCPVELHKTHDHAMYYKCTDVAQMLIVYEDMTALEEAESMPKYKIDGFPSYYHSGLTPPTSRIVEKRFKERVHAAIPPPVPQMQQVESELIELMESISTKDSTKPKKNPKTALNKVLEEVEEVVVQYEPWMDDNGAQPNGVEFDESDDLCKQHPELWFTPKELEEEAKASRPTVVHSASAKRNKSLTPDAPLELRMPSDSSTSTKKKKTSKSKKKKRTSKKKPKGSANVPVQPAAMTPVQPVIESQSIQNADIANLDEIDLNMDALDDFEDMAGLDGDFTDDLFLM